MEDNSKKLREQIAIKMAQYNMSSKDLADKMKINLRTLQRRMLKPEKFTFEELEALTNVLKIDLNFRKITNREWLNSLSDEDFAKWCVYPEDVDFDTCIANEPSPKLNTIMFSGNNSYYMVLEWLKQERNEQHVKVF